ncbi:hypothetical protein P171DRAFT_72446 [Karstenula rhodostoma CBS 690.94]|uniref:Uncharacterized protein n=1 Tax=Karstenula rhodostoma CBS 690.94 TaxID=1392251 RepID=A0A9P4U9V0_9PLEO|nr:hypothetical protein P171DRAFT_72446 [Karstenula rhodostoma CBS 690.94]
MRGDISSEARAKTRNYPSQQTRCLNSTMSSSPLLRAHEPPHEPIGESDKRMSSLRDKLVYFFSTRTFHYSVLLLVALDVGCMFAGTQTKC